jgi:hypothetical protein
MGKLTYWYLLFVFQSFNSTYFSFETVPVPRYECFSIYLQDMHEALAKEDAKKSENKKSPKIENPFEKCRQRFLLSVEPFRDFVK